MTTIALPRTAVERPAPQAGNRMGWAVSAFGADNPTVAKPQHKV